jgi:hypothetical protein
MKEETGAAYLELRLEGALAVENELLYQGPYVHARSRHTLE